jgi:Fungal Zn(2)-Cys(6) binuclear cluster domain
VNWVPVSTRAVSGCHLSLNGLVGGTERLIDSFRLLFFSQIFFAFTGNHPTHFHSLSVSHHFTVNMYTNQPWTQFPIDSQSQAQANYGGSYHTQPQSQDALFPQDSYSDPYASQYVSSPDIPSFVSGQSQPQPIQHQFFGDATPVPVSVATNQQVDPAYYAPAVQPNNNFSPQTPYINTAFDRGGSGITYISSSPQSDSVLASRGAVLPSSPNPNYGFAPRSSHAQPYYPTSTATPVPGQKRQRGHDTTDDGEEGQRATSVQKEGQMKVKLSVQPYRRVWCRPYTRSYSAACTRCKNQKVKCEMKSESDPCKRCLNAGQPCVIPGKKKRRTPPSVLIVISFSPCIENFPCYLPENANIF